MARSGWPSAVSARDSSTYASAASGSYSSDAGSADRRPSGSRPRCMYRRESARSRPASLSVPSARCAFSRCSIAWRTALSAVAALVASPSSLLGQRREDAAEHAMRVDVGRVDLQRGLAPTGGVLEPALTLRRARPVRQASPPTSDPAPPRADTPQSPARARLRPRGGGRAGTGSTRRLSTSRKTPARRRQALTRTRGRDEQCARPTHDAAQGPGTRQQATSRTASSCFMTAHARCQPAASSRTSCVIVTFGGGPCPSTRSCWPSWPARSARRR